VGSLKPNDLGLFDVHGNVFTWCQESYKSYPNGNDAKASEDKEDGLVVLSTFTRMLRGATRSAARNNYEPTIQWDVNGVRPARTFTP
jgi:formylglycine-generating enzyme required for sulfatase activity